MDEPVELGPVCFPKPNLIIYNVHISLGGRRKKGRGREKITNSPPFPLPPFPLPLSTPAMQALFMIGVSPGNRLPNKRRKSAEDEVAYYSSASLGYRGF